MDSLVWTEENVLLKDLKEYDKNPRSISHTSFRRLVESIKEHGYNNRMLVDTDNTIIGGHQRRLALLKSGYKNTDTIKVLKPNRKLTEEEFKRLNVRDNGSFGDFNLDMLSMDFDVPELLELGVPEFLFKDLAVEELDEAQEEVDQIEPEKNPITCPHCGKDI